MPQMAACRSLMDLASIIRFKLDGYVWQWLSFVDFIRALAPHIGPLSVSIMRWIQKLLAQRCPGDASKADLRKIWADLRSTHHCSKQWGKSCVSAATQIEVPADRIMKYLDVLAVLTDMQRRFSVPEGSPSLLRLAYATAPFSTGSMSVCSPFSPLKQVEFEGGEDTFKLWFRRLIGNVPTTKATPQPSPAVEVSHRSMKRLFQRSLHPYVEGAQLLSPHVLEHLSNLLPPARFSARLIQTRPVAVLNPNWECNRGEDWWPGTASGASQILFTVTQETKQARREHVNRAAASLTATTALDSDIEHFAGPGVWPSLYRSTQTWQPLKGRTPKDWSEPGWHPLMATQPAGALDKSRVEYYRRVLVEAEAAHNGARPTVLVLQVRHPNPLI